MSRVDWLSRPLSPRARLIWLALLLLVLLAAFWPTVAGMIEIWTRSETFTHGFLVLPAVLFMIWRERAGLREVVLRGEPLALLAIAAGGLVWLLARLTEVAVIEQLALVGLSWALIGLVLGRTMLWRLAFPLAFLLFAVPMGEGLIYPLMEFTAAFTVNLLRLTGIPVFWDGTFFSIPSGDWSVVEGCSGVRYLIASLFLGVIYAYLSYRSPWRRLAFIVLAAVVPLLANGLRAYLIVIIAHLSDMRLAVGVDHLIYGWVFFGLVMFVLFLIGGLWREPPRAEPETPTVSSTADRRGARRRGGHALPALGLALLLAWPALAADLERPRAIQPLALAPLAAPADWTTGAAFTEWRPTYLGASATLEQVFVRDGEPVGFYLAGYAGEGGELVNSQNVLVAQKHPRWKMPQQAPRREDLAGGSLGLIESRVRTPEQTLLVWHWYWIDGAHLANDYLAKLHEALALLQGRGRHEAGVVIYTPLGLDPQAARARLRALAEPLRPALDALLEAPSRPAAGVHDGRE
ncbi:exosortase A [Marichromatium gracile]|uniref:Exosortase A n=1 Tax=Marichromatium gracile TaxID=1048 RepID=A0A4R4A9E8_MARGR|nr:exosortase A [Marichromatium gracile]MBK1708019.1 exosortase A [Marichromatium gracile]TCW35146.1 exosortase A [Marichromatium gracile]